MNKVILQGRLTADIELKGKGTKYAQFVLAVRDGVDADGEPRTQFIRCVAFGKGAEVLNQFTGKGSPLCVCGRLNNSSYEDEKGETKWSTQVMVDDFDFAGSAPKEEKQEEQPKKNNSKKYHK